MSFNTDEINLAIAQHGTVYRVVIVAIRGSSPREVGASMLLWPGGQSGSIGGGALEFQATQALEIGLRKYPLGPELGQCCGGHVTLVTERFDKPVTRSSYFVRQFSGTSGQPLEMARMQKSICNGSVQPVLMHGDGWLAEPINLPAQPLWIWGAGHVGRSVVEIVKHLPDFEITWVDTSKERYPSEIPEGVTVVPTAEPALLMAHAPTHALHLIFTYSHAIDLALCNVALSRGFEYCGLIGSASKWARFRARLSALGHTPSKIGEITCPIGDPSLGKQPISIAIGVTQALLTRHSIASAKRSVQS